MNKKNGFGKEKGSVNRATPILKEKLLEELKINWGIALPSCNKLGIPRATFESWMKADEEFRKQVQLIREHKIDLAESKLVEAANAGQPWAITLILKYLGKTRGYSEKQEIDMNITNKEIRFVFGSDSDSKEENNEE